LIHCQTFPIGSSELENLQTITSFWGSSLTSPLKHPLDEERPACFTGDGFIVQSPAKKGGSFNKVWRHPATQRFPHQKLDHQRQEFVESPTNSTDMDRFSTDDPAMVWLTLAVLH